jgi:N-ethylmaleimide reductase
MSSEISLFTPIKLGANLLPNRIVMAPLTRSRAGEGNVPQAINVEYYAQRASAGLIITEATQIAPQGQGYIATPGIHSTEQIAGWRLVTDAVHARNGHIFLQLWHVGRISHSSFQPNGELPVAPSAIAPPGNIFTNQGPKPYETPRALDLTEIPGIIEQYRQAAQNALAAGFDGVEIHGANGYLLDQFLRDGTNKRDDQYGGSIENRARLLLEVTRAVVSVWGADRVGVRLSPSGTFNSMSDSNPRETFRYVIEQLDQFNLAYLHLTEPQADDQKYGGPGIPTSYFRPFYKGNLIVNGGYNQATANAAIDRGNADLIAFGVLYIANPDLVERFRLNAPLNQPDQPTFYSGGTKGYIDYPALSLQNA